MDFFLSFRLFQDPAQLKLENEVESTNSYLKRSTFINFLFLTVDNTIWKYLQIPVILIRFFVTTFTVTFAGIENSFHATDAVNVFCDITFFIDFISALIYRCKWPKQSKPPEKLTSHLERLVWKNSFYKPRKVWMLIFDGFTLIPFELLRFIIPTETYLLTVCYYVAALRVYRIIILYSQNMKIIFFRKTSITELILKFSAFWLLLSHVLTCFYSWFAWQVNSKFIEEAKSSISFNENNYFHWYSLIFYVVQFAFQNIGFGDIPPSTDMERLLILIITLVGFSTFNGYIISALSNVLTENFRRVHDLRLRLSLMKFDLFRRKIPQEKIDKILGFYHSLWTLRKGIGPIDETLISLPDSVWGRVYYDIFAPAINASLLFRYCDNFSKRAIAKTMQIELYMAGDIILRRSEINSKLFYVRKGTIEIMSYQDDETQIMTFGAGSVFGQFALLLSLPARSEVHAATFCEIHVLTRLSLFKVLIDYPKAKEIIVNVHKNLLLNVLADKFNQESNPTKPNNILKSDIFYKVPIEASKIARNDICVVNTCPYVYEPFTIFSKLWDTMTAVFIVVIAFFYPYCAAFDRKYPVKSEPFIIISDAVLFLNLYLTFSTAILKENVLFSSIRDIITLRLTNFSTYIDCIALLPLHYFLDHNNRLKPIVLCLRCLELYKIHFYFMSAETSVSMKMISFLRLIKYVLYFFFIGYITGVIFYLQACFEDPCIPDSWYVQNEVAQKAKSPAWISMYSVIMITSTTGYGDVLPKNIQDLYFVTAFCLFGVFLFIYLVAEFSANLSLTRSSRQNFLGFAEGVNSFLRAHEISSNEILRVRQFLNLQWESSMGYEIDQKNNLYYDTPQHLLADLNQYTRFRGLQNLELFKDMDKNIINGFLVNSYRIILPPHEVVIYAGEVISHLIMIEEGFCEITYGKDITLKKIIGAGQDICSVELVSGLTSLCNVRTLTHCTLLKLSKENLMGVLSVNPLIAAELIECIKEFKENPILKEIQKTRPNRLYLVVHSSAQESFYRFRYFHKQGGNEELKNPFLKLGLCQWIRFFFGRATILPYGKFLKAWELLRCLFAFCSAMLFPLLPYFQLEVPAFYYLGYFLDFTAWADLYFRLHVCYYNKKNLLVFHPLWTASHYIKGSFILDFIFCFPFDRIMFRNVYDSTGFALVTVPPIDFLRSLRVAQIYRIPPAVNNLGIDFLSPPSLFRVFVMMIALSLVFLNVLTSILMLAFFKYKVDKKGNYICIIQPSIREKYLENLKKFNFTTDPLILYFLNFYWVCETAFFLGFGDLTSDAKELMIFSICVIIISYLYFSYVTIAIASYISSVNINITIYQKRMGHLIKFLKKENVLPRLRQHIINHFEYTWKKNKGMEASFTAEFFLLCKNGKLAKKGLLFLKRSAIHYNLSFFFNIYGLINVNEKVPQWACRQDSYKSHELMRMAPHWYNCGNAFNQLLLYTARYIVKHFNIALQNDILLYLYEKTLKGVNAFSQVDQSFIRIISKHVLETNFIAGAAIYKKKDVISEICIIHQGEVTLVGKNEDETITLGVSQVFGHLENIPRALAKNSAVATKNVTILRIKTTEFYQLLADFNAAIQENKQKEEEKMRDALIESKDLQLNEIKKKQVKIEGTFAYMTYKYLKYILIFYLILSWFSINEVSYNAAFQSYNIASASILALIECLFIFKIFLGFKTGFVNEAGDFISDSPKIRQSYMKITGFYLDFFTVIPFEIFALAFKEEDQAYAASLFRISKYLRARNIQYFFNLKFDTLSVNMVSLKVMAVTVWTITLLHQCTCVWFFISCNRSHCPDSVTWNQALDGDFQNFYISSLYFVVIVLTTTGFGDITPHTPLEIFFVEMLSSFAFFTTAVFIGQIMSSIHKYFLSKTKYEFAVRGLKIYLHVNDIPNETQEFVFRYIGNIWRNEKGYQIPELLRNGPSYLIHEIKQSTYGHHINNNPVFKPCDPFFRKKLINEFRRTVYFPGDVIVHEGEVNRTMYFVHTGLVGSMDLGNAYAEKTYGENTFFGLRQGVFKREPHKTTYRAKTLSIILSLELKHWSFLSEFYSKDIEHIQKETKSNKWM